MDNSSAARLSRAGDEQALAGIWQESFGDDMPFISRFMEMVYEPGMASVAELEGEPVSAIYLFEDVWLVDEDGETVPAPYCYTLGTLKKARGRGLGAAVSEHIMHRAMETAPLVALLPAEGSLYGWYARTFGLEPISQTREQTLTLSELPEGTAAAHRTVAASYARLRELMLQGKPHARFGGKLLAWYDDYIRAENGGLYLLEDDGAVGCAACEVEGDTLFIKELLMPGCEPWRAAAKLAQISGKEKLVLRTPLFFPGDGPVRDFAVARCREGFTLPPKEELWWGLAFD